MRQWCLEAVLLVCPYVIAALGLFLFVAGMGYLLIPHREISAPLAVVSSRDIKEWAFQLCLANAIAGLGGLAAGPFLMRLTSLSRERAVLVTLLLAAGAALTWMVIVSGVAR